MYNGRGEEKMVGTMNGVWLPVLPAYLPARSSCANMI